MLEKATHTHTFLPVVANMKIIPVADPALASHRTPDDRIYEGSIELMAHSFRQQFMAYWLSDGSLAAKPNGTASNLH